MQLTNWSDISTAPCNLGQHSTTTSKGSPSQRPTGTLSSLSTGPGAWTICTGTVGVGLRPDMVPHAVCENGWTQYRAHEPGARGLSFLCRFKPSSSKHKAKQKKKKTDKSERHACCVPSFLSFSPRPALPPLVFLPVEGKSHRHRHRVGVTERRPQTEARAFEKVPEGGSGEMQGATHMLLEEPLRLASVLAPAKPVRPFPTPSISLAVEARRASRCGGWCRVVRSGLGWRVQGHG
jgi:hypothetical protein